MMGISASDAPSVAAVWAKAQEISNAAIAKEVRICSLVCSILFPVPAARSPSAPIAVASLSTEALPSNKSLNCWSTAPAVCPCNTVMVLERIRFSSGISADICSELLCQSLPIRYIASSSPFGHCDPTRYATHCK